MSKRIPIGIVIALLLVSIAATSVISVNYVVNKNNALLIDLPARAQQYSDLAEIEEIVRREYFGNVDSASIDRSLAEGYLDGLGDSFCYYIAAEDYDAFMNLMSGITSGVGISVYYENTTDNLVINSVLDDTPAAEAGLQVNYQITSVNGKNVSADNCDEIISVLCDSNCEKIKVAFVKSTENKDEKPSEVEMQSGYIEMSVTSKTENGVGYIHISNYFDSTINEFHEALNKFEEDGVKDIVIDLRNSSGVNLDVAAELIDIIVPVGNEGTGAIYTARNTAGEIVKQASSDANSLSLNFAVLVNSRTECAAELVACDLRDFGKAVLVGEKTSGHGSLQEIFRLEDGSAITLTVAEISPYISDSFNDVGLEPDLVVEVPTGFLNNIGSVNLSDDPQFQAAAALLKSK